jgi:hypothetical protein
MEVSAANRELLSEILFFEPVTAVRRVVFMAVPHRGADMAAGTLGKLGVALTVPAPWLVELTGDVAPGDGDLAGRLTGIGSLRPDNPALLEMDTWPLPGGLAVHSVIGNMDAADVSGGTDGVVPYESSHLEGVASEKVIHSGHSVQYYPAGIQEVRRILHLHLEE